MANANKIYFILTGQPGVGKTTLIKKIYSILSEKGIKAVGFYTEEVRKNRVREGFDVVSLQGSRGRLARCQSLLTKPSNFNVGKYGILLEEFESVLLTSLIERIDTHGCLIIDEIGKMELFSNKFKDWINEIFNPSSNQVILATIPIRNCNPLIESIRNNIKSRIWVVTKENRSMIHEEILNAMYNALKI